MLGSLKEAAGWPETDRNTVVTLATTLVAADADPEGSRFFQDQSERNPANATAQARRGGRQAVSRRLVGVAEPGCCFGLIVEFPEPLLEFR